MLNEGKIGWAEEALLLTHEAMRRDMATMNECLELRFFGALPESWRVRAFFRFFSGWSALLSQHHAVEVAVHCDWLAAPTGELPQGCNSMCPRLQPCVPSPQPFVSRRAARQLPAGAAHVSARHRDHCRSRGQNGVEDSARAQPGGGLAPRSGLEDPSHAPSMTASCLLARSPSAPAAPAGFRRAWAARTASRGSDCAHQTPRDQPRLKPRA